MDIFTSYGIAIKNKEFRNVFAATTELYRKAVDFFINVRLLENEDFQKIKSSLYQLHFMEQLTHKTKGRSVVKYDFDKSFYKFPSYYRRAAINEALGKADSYLSNLFRWEKIKVGKKPSYPTAGYAFPALYRNDSYIRTDTYTADIKVFIRNTWDWISIDLNKGDTDYILHHCKDRKECVPVLSKRYKKWYLQFSFEETVCLNKTPIEKANILAVDLGINNACTYAVMRSDGAVIGREFLSLPVEQDSLEHITNRIKQAQQKGINKPIALWNAANGVNDRIAVLTAQHIIDVAKQYQVSTIVFEHLETVGKKKGSKKQKLALWKKRYVQSMVTNKAHRLGIRISHVNAANTSRLAFDGSGKVKRGKEINQNTSYSICRFATGKVYNCDLNAAYNIGARYFVRELLKSCSETKRLGIEAKVPQCAKRSTCTLSTLISLNAVLAA